MDKEEAEWPLDPGFPHLILCENHWEGQPVNLCPPPLPSAASPDRTGW